MEVDWKFDFPFIITPIASNAGFLLEVLDKDGCIVFCGSYSSVERIGQELDFWRRNHLFVTNGRFTDKNADKG